MKISNRYKLTTGASATGIMDDWNSGIIGFGEELQKVDN